MEMNQNRKAASKFLDLNEEPCDGVAMKQIPVRMPQATYVQLCKMAEGECRSVSGQILKLIQEALKKSLLESK